MLKLTAQDLKQLGVIEEVVSEPTGGAHRNHKEASEILQSALIKNLAELEKLSVGELVDNRYKKYRNMGHFTEVN